MPLSDSLDYLNLNSFRNYPIREGLSAKSSGTPQVRIPDDFIVDFQVAATTDVTRRFYISRLTNKHSEAVVEVSDEFNKVVGVFVIAFAAHTKYKYYFMQAGEDYTGANGRLVVDSIDSLKRLPAGIFSFTITATEFEPVTSVPSVTAVDRIIFVDTSGNSFSKTNDVTMLGRINLRFRYDVGDDRVLLDAGDGLGLNVNCPEGPCIKRINGVTPDADGNVSLLGLECSSFSSPSANTLQLDDNCCTPCSGCEDLAALTERLTSLETRFLDLKDLYNLINNQLSIYLTTANANCVCN